jgi:hypothetical protein
VGNALALSIMSTAVAAAAASGGMVAKPFMAAARDENQCKR